MQERSEAERRAIRPCLNVATWRRFEATEPYNKYDKIRPHSIRSLQFDQKDRPLSFRPEKFDLFTATRGRRHTPVVCNESREPHTSHYTSRPVTKKTTNKLLKPATMQSTGGIFLSCFDIKVKKIDYM